MKSRIIITGFVCWICLLVGARVNAQNTVLELFKTARDYVRVIDSLGIEIDYIDFNVLTNSQNYRETWQSLVADYNYSIIAFGNENIKKLKVELYEYKGSDWSFLERGKPIADYQLYTSMIDEYMPTADVSGMIRVTAEEFTQDATNGRYFVVAGKTLSAVNLVTVSRVPVKINTSTLKQTPTGKAENFVCTFKIYQNLIQQFYGTSLQKEFKIIENLSTQEDMNSGIYLYELEDYSGYSYTMIIYTVEKMIALYDDVKRQNVYTGWVYSY